MTVAGPAVWEVVVAGPTLVTVLPLEPLQTPAQSSLLVTLTPHRPLPVTLTPLAASVRVVVPCSLHTPLALSALSQARTDTAACVRVTDMAWLTAGRTFLTAAVGETPVSHLTGVTPRSSNPRLTDTLAGEIVTVVVLRAHGITVTLPTALA